MVSFQHTQRRAWFTTAHKSYTAHITGWAYNNNTFRAGLALAHCVIDRLCAAELFPDILCSLNGNFAIVVENSGQCLCAVDHVRSIPLFYRTCGDTLYVADDVRLLLQGNESFDSDSLLEFATAGYVTGPHTLYNSIAGLHSGQCLMWQAGWTAPRHASYYKYTCRYDSGLSVDVLCAEFDNIILAAFRRIVESARGCQIVVPLSGGLDSRLVAATLKRLKYDNVVCFAYGIRGSRDCMVSRQVAERLGYPWFQTAYSASVLRTALASAEMRDYRSFSANAVSLPHCDDWPAVRLLQAQACLQRDAVFMPGHTGDFISGGHLKYIFDPHWHSNPFDFSGAMIKKHYSLWSSLSCDTKIRQALECRLREALTLFSLETHEDLAQAYEYWEWQERQSKYIINAVRAYEFFNYQWRIPLWDLSVMDFWKQVPLPLKSGKCLYRKYLMKYDPLGVFRSSMGQEPRPEAVAEGNRRSFRRGLKAALQMTRPTASALRLLQNWSRQYRFYRHNPTGFARAYNPFRYVFLEPTKRHVVALLAKDVLRDQYGVRLGDMPGIAESSGALHQDQKQ